MFVINIFIIGVFVLIFVLTPKTFASNDTDEIDTFNCQIIRVKDIGKNVTAALAGVNEIVTPSTNDLFFRYYPIIEPSKPHFGCFSFKVRAASNAIISLSNNALFTENTFSVVLGAYKNTKTVIRKKLNGHLLEKDTKSILSSEEFRKFWIKWEPDGTIELGEGGTDEKEMSLLMSFQEKHLYPVNFIGILTCCGINGRWLFEEPSCPGFNPMNRKFETKCFNNPQDLEAIADFSSVSTENLIDNNSTPDFLTDVSDVSLFTTSNSLDYKYILVTDNCFKFKVKASHDVNLILENKNHSIEIIIGSWYNLKSGILRKTRRKVEILAQNDTSLILNANDYTEFWIEWIMDQLLVGKFNQNSEAWNFMFVENLRDLHFDKIGIRTVHGVNGQWIVENCKCPIVLPFEKDGNLSRNNSFLSF